MNRQAALKRLREEKEWDIIIIGGGATGLGAAVDAASRGYRTVLLEAFDFAKGTSSRATKLVHGGVRYLAQGNLKLVKEALRERGLLLKNAPHITSGMTFIIPVYSFFEKMFYGVGLGMYDMLSGKLSLGKTKWLGKQKVKELLPGLTEKGLTGGIAYHDGQFDDARLAIDLARTAVRHGGVVINYCKASALLKKDGKINGVTAKDAITGDEYQLKAKVVINATGVFSDEVMKLDDDTHEAMVKPSQGIHLVVDKSFFETGHSLMIPKTEDGRVLFAVPWHDKIVIGTTDTEIPDISTEPKPLEEEIEFILHHANKYFKKNIQRRDVRSMFAGLRPLVKQKAAKNTSLISRDHIIIASVSGLITVTGGKWTTYRKMAEDAINHAVIIGKLPRRECVTRQLSIGPGEEATAEHKGETVLHNGVSITENDIEYFVKHEMAQTVEDILARRTRLLFLDARSAISKSYEVALSMAKHMGKDEQWAKEQSDTFNELANNYVLGD